MAGTDTYKWDPHSKSVLAARGRGKFGKAMAQRINGTPTNSGDIVNPFQQGIMEQMPKERTPQLTGKDREAYDWATSNPTDPRAIAILEKLGAK